jgi:hypothetical protein
MQASPAGTGPLDRLFSTLPPPGLLLPMPTVQPRVYDASSAAISGAFAASSPPFFLRLS